jgi:Inner membrane component of T3SS, cytoplasmic domain
MPTDAITQRLPLAQLAPIDPDLQTAPFDAALAPRPDAFAVLDHRARSLAVPRRTALPGHYIAFADAAGDERLIPLEDSILHVGRATSAELRLEDAHVSRRHAIIVRHGRHVRVLDDRSATGTFVNGTRVIATDVRSGDVIRLGPVSFSYLEIA